MTNPRACIEMPIHLVMNDWHKNGKSVYNTEEGVELSYGDFHGGTTFDGKISLTMEQYDELKDAFKKGYEPVFWVSRRDLVIKPQKLSLFQQVKKAFIPEPEPKPIEMFGFGTLKKEDIHDSKGPDTRIEDNGPKWVSDSQPGL